MRWRWRWRWRVVSNPADGADRRVETDGHRRDERTKGPNQDAKYSCGRLVWAFGCLGCGRGASDVVWMSWYAAQMQSRHSPRSM
jgi:hypothetical protein